MATFFVSSKPLIDDYECDSHFAVCSVVGAKLLSFIVDLSKIEITGT